MKFWSILFGKNQNEVDNYGKFVTS